MYLLKCAVQAVEGSLVEDSSLKLLSAVIHSNSEHYHNIIKALMSDPSLSSASYEK